MRDLFQLVGRGSYHWPAMDITVDSDQPFLFVDEGDSDLLATRDAFEYVGGQRLEDALGGDTDEVLAAIDNGAHDEILDYLLYAETEHENRPQVCEAIVHRSETIKRMQEEDDDSAVDPTSLTVGR